MVAISSRCRAMIITPEESQAYRIRRDTTNEVDRVFVTALRRHVAAEMKAEAWLNWIMNGKVGPLPSIFNDVWERAADVALRGEKVLK